MSQEVNLQFPNKIFSQLLNEILQEFNISQHRIAEETGMKQSDISAFLTGYITNTKRRPVSLGNFEKLLIYLEKVAPGSAKTFCTKLSMALNATETHPIANIALEKLILDAGTLNDDDLSDLLIWAALEQKRRQEAKKNLRHTQISNHRTAIKSRRKPIKNIECETKRDAIISVTLNPSTTMRTNLTSQQLKRLKESVEEYEKKNTLDPIAAIEKLGISAIERRVLFEGREGFQWKTEVLERLVLNLFNQPLNVFLSSNNASHHMY